MSIAGKIDRYNARVLEQVARNLTRLAKDERGVTSDPEFFTRPLALEGQQQSLNEYESTLRALGEPAAHFAVNCGSVGCPKLAATPFSQAADVAAELRRLEGESMLSSARVVSENGGAVVVEVIELYSWYAKDFSGVDPAAEPARHWAAIRARLVAGLPAKSPVRAALERGAPIRARSDWDWHVNAVLPAPRRDD